jgi:hypothetical protein
MSFNSQLIRARAIVISDKKETNYGTALLDASLTHSLRFDGGAFSTLPEQQFFSDAGLAKGFPWASVRTEIQRDAKFSLSGAAVYDYFAGWIGAFLFGKVTTTGAVSPYTHKFTADLSTLLSPVTSIWIQDTADVKYKLMDLAITSAKFNGGAVGPVTCDIEMIGSGHHLDAGTFVAPALANPTFILNNDADILLGPPGAPVSIKQRVRSWSVSIDGQQEAVRHPGGGIYAGYHRRGDMKFGLQMQVSAKDVDDIRTLLINGTEQEVQINVNSGAAAQLKFRFPHVKFKGGPAADGNFVAYNLTVDDNGLLANNYPTDEPFEMTVVNGQASWLTAG